MKKKILASCILFFWCKLPFAQDYFYNNHFFNATWLLELSVSGGVINGLTDLGGMPGKGKGFIRDANWQLSKPAFSVDVGLSHNQAIAVRLRYTHGSVVGSDAVLKNDHSIGRHRYYRNLHVTTPVRELAVLTEVYPLEFLLSHQPMVSPFFTAGVGILHFNPLTNLNGQNIALRPLRTEGQGLPGRPMPYGNYAVSFPVGLGVRVDYHALWAVNISLMHRFTNTDYLDDVSTTFVNPNLFDELLSPANAANAKALYAQTHRELVVAEGAIRGNPNNKDGYFTLQAGISFLIGRKRR